MAEKSSELSIFVDSDETVINNSDNISLQKGEENSLANKTDDDNDEVLADTNEIREQIAETRRGMSETIDAIQEKLSFSNISEQVREQVSEQIGGAVESVKQVAAEKAGDFMKAVDKGVRQVKKSEIVKTVQQNPWLLGLIGAGLGALVIGGLVKGKKKKLGSYQYEDEFDFDDADKVKYSDNSRSNLKSGEAEESETETTRSKIGGAASVAYESISGAAGKTYEGVTNATGFAYHKAGDLGGHVKTNYDYYIEESPLIVGAVAVAIGAAIGFAIPLTKTENHYFGKIRDDAFEKVQTTAQEAIGTVKQVANEAQRAFVEEAKGKSA